MRPASFDFEAQVAGKAFLWPDEEDTARAAIDAAFSAAPPMCPPVRQS